MNSNISQASVSKRNIRVAWFTFGPPSLYGINASGSWISSLREALLKRHEIDLRFIVLKSSIECDYGEDKEKSYIVSTPKKHDGRAWPTEEMVESFRSIINEIEPDVIHIWGTEWCGPILAVLAGQKAPILINVQGIPLSITQHLLGTRKMCSLIRWVGPHEILAQSGLFRHWRGLRRAAQMERIAIKRIKYYQCSTSFKEAWIYANNPAARIFSLQSLLRPPFYQANWSLDLVRRYSIFLVDAFTAYKGFDLILKAAELLIREYPELRIRVCGPIPRQGFFKASSFEKYINSVVSKPTLKRIVEFLGPLDAFGIAQEMEKAHCVVVSSLIESESQVASEAMAVGAPLVVPFTGGITDLFEHMKSAVGYTVANHMCLAYGIRKIFNDDSLAITLSKNARVTAHNRNDPKNVVDTLILNYQKLIKSNQSSLRTHIREIIM